MPLIPSPRQALPFCCPLIVLAIGGHELLAASPPDRQAPPPDQGSVASSGKFVPPPAPPGAQGTPKMTHEEAAAALRDGLKIERLDGGKLRIGTVTLDPDARSIRFPATVNMTEGPVEYAVVTEMGKRHESVFLTKASPRDVHLAMLLLGVKPGGLRAGPDRRLEVPATAAVKASVEWESNGPPAKHPLASAIAFAHGSPEQATGRTLPDEHWVYNGSSFDGAAFRVLREGSLISLIGDDAALLNNPGSDRDNDDLHTPNKNLLPRVGMPVSIVLALVAKPDLRPAAGDPTLAEDFLDQLAAAGADRSLTLVLPDGQPVLGAIDGVQRRSGRVFKLSGTLQHPEPGDFSLTCQSAPDGSRTPSGTLRFANQSVEWVIEPAPTPGRFQWVKKPAPAAYRLRNPASTPAATGPPTPTGPADRFPTASAAPPTSPPSTSPPTAPSPSIPQSPPVP